MGKHDASDISKYTVSSGWLAEACHISPRRVRQLAAEGTFVRASQGQYYASRSIQNYVALLERRSAAQNRVTPATRLMDRKADLIELRMRREASTLIAMDEAIEGLRYVADTYTESMDELTRQVAQKAGKDRSGRERIRAIITDEKARLASKFDKVIERLRAGQNSD